MGALGRLDRLGASLSAHVLVSPHPPSLPHLLPGPEATCLSPPGHSPGSGQPPVPALFIKGMTAEIHLKMKKVPANPFCKTLID